MVSSVGEGHFSVVFLLGHEGEISGAFSGSSGSRVVWSSLEDI